MLPALPLLILPTLSLSSFTASGRLMLSGSLAGCSSLGGVGLAVMWRSPTDRCRMWRRPSEKSSCGCHCRPRPETVKSAEGVSIRQSSPLKPCHSVPLRVLLLIFTPPSSGRVYRPKRRPDSVAASQYKKPADKADSRTDDHRTVFNSRRAGDLSVRVFSDGLLLSGAPFSDGLCISSCAVI